MGDAARIGVAGQLIHIKLTPKASSNRIGEMRKDAHGNDVLSVYVTAPPDKNKANEALIELLADHYGIAPSRLTLVRGHTARTKTIRLDE